MPSSLGPLSMLSSQAAAGTAEITHREAVDATRRGLPVTDIEQLIRAGRLTLAEVDHVVLPRKTLSHRRKLGTLTPEQSDRLLRVVRIIAAAENTFGSQEKASRWLRRPSAALQGDVPMALLDTGEGTRAVEDLLHLIDHGLAA